MKKRILSCAAVVFALLLSGCGEPDTTRSFEAVIDAVTPAQETDQASSEDPSMGSILVTLPQEETSESGFDKAYVGIHSSTDIILTDGRKGSIDDLKTGMNIKVTFNGVVRESYPVQLTASKITILS